ncbi:SMI1/KNR4 family protein [Clostridium sp. YIM B02505]|uniref:SMI1/KNR4 family protein n=1 Tax=Clostridium yunnanense TaxID=2800325 RepID=A0ABS1ERX7_9CLOT|nr:SMI1/KNR4 family protein [Clostridium yunnanense]MBK1812160.1 SMI1/KNR4 family protein [Clostridium yunnanense]
MKADFYNKYFYELNEEQIELLKKLDITKENMCEYSYMADEQGNIDRPIADDIIDGIIKELEIAELPRSYIEYLKTYGDGGWGCIWIYGVYVSQNIYTKGKIESRMVDATLRYRESFSWSKEIICIAIGQICDGLIFCLDTSRMCNGECPVVVFNEQNMMFNEYATDFKEFVKKYITYGIACELKRFSESEEERSAIKLINGTGYKSCWFVAKGTTKEKLAEVLGLSRKKKMTWDEGIEFVNNVSNFNNHPVFITSKYDNKIYVIGNGLYKLADNPDKLLELGKLCKELCFYLTERNSETHCFAKISKGEVKRFYFYNEEKIINMGKITQIEKQLKMKFPSDFNEAFDGKHTQINEEHIIQIANKWSSENIKDYPYKDVLTGLI